MNVNILLRTGSLHNDIKKGWIHRSLEWMPAMFYVLLYHMRCVIAPSIHRARSMVFVVQTSKQQHRWGADWSKLHEKRLAKIAQLPSFYRWASPLARHTFSLSGPQKFSAIDLGGGKEIVRGTEKDGIKMQTIWIHICGINPKAMSMQCSSSNQS